MCDILNLDEQTQRKQKENENKFHREKAKTGRTLPEEEEIQQISQ